MIEGLGAHSGMVVESVHDGVDQFCGAMRRVAELRLRGVNGLLLQALGLPTARLDSATSDPDHAATHQNFEPNGKRD